MYNSVTTKTSTNNYNQLNDTYANIQTLDTLGIKQNNHGPTDRSNIKDSLDNSFEITKWSHNGLVLLMNQPTYS